MLFGHRPSFDPFARPFRRSGLTADEAIIHYDDRWADFLAAVPPDEELAAMSDGQLNHRFGLDPSMLASRIPGAVHDWRESPSRSMINIVANIGSGVPSGPMFADIKDQTRIVASTVARNAIDLVSVRGVDDEKGRPLRAWGDAYAVTLVPEGISRLNDVARAVHVWELRNRARVDTGLVRLPKKLYRGVRRAGLKDLEFEWPKDVPHNIGQCRKAEASLEHVCSLPLAASSGSRLLSFTSVEQIAKRFTNAEGLIIEIDPSTVDVVASWATDEALSGKDSVLNLHEKEWILRFNDDYIPSPEDVSIWDRLYAFSCGDPSGIEMIHHTNVARYTLEGRNVEVSFRYNSTGIGGRIVYALDDNWIEKGRMTWKKETGFDPMPSPGREAVDLVFFNRERWTSKITKFEPYVRVPNEEQELSLAFR